MARRGWHGIRQAWRICRWIGCREQIAAPYAQLGSSHLRELERLDGRLERSQLEFQFIARPALPTPRLVVDNPEYQLAFDMPRPKLYGAHEPKVAIEPSWEEERREILRDIWNERKEKHAARMRMLDKEVAKHERNIRRSG